MNHVRLILVGWLVVCLPMAVFSQEIHYSDYQPFEYRSGDFSVVGKVGERLYTYRGTPDGFVLDVYNDSMKLQATVILDFFPDKVYETRFITTATNIIILYQSIETNKVVQYAALLDNMGRLQKQPIQLDETKVGILGATKQYYLSAVSDNKSYILVYSADVHKRDIDFSGIWLDGQLNVLYRTKTTFNADNDVSHGDGIIANDGTFYMPCYTLVGAKDYADRIWLLALKQNETTFTSKELPLNNLFAGNIYMKADNAKNKIYFGGFYADKKNGGCDGLLFANYGITEGSFGLNKMTPFDTYLRTAIGERNKKHAFDDFKVRQMIIKNDGGCIFVFESYYASTRNTGYSPGFGGFNSMYSFSPMSRTVHEYHYNDILAISCNGTGAIDWNTIIRKEQFSQEDAGLFSSYVLINSGGMLGFLYNNSNTGGHAHIQLSTLDADGKSNTHLLNVGNREDPDWLARSAKQVASREIVVPCLRKKQICFAKIVF